MRQRRAGREDESTNREKQWSSGAAHTNVHVHVDGSAETREEERGEVKASKVQGRGQVASRFFVSVDLRSGDGHREGLEVSGQEWEEVWGGQERKGGRGGSGKRGTRGRRRIEGGLESQR